MLNLGTRPAWHEQAACQKHRRLNFTDDTNQATLRRMRAVCDCCPVQYDCLDDAMTSWAVGMRAGLTEAERLELRGCA